MAAGSSRLSGRALAGIFALVLGLAVAGLLALSFTTGTLGTFGRHIRFGANHHMGLLRLSSKNRLLSGRRAELDESRCAHGAMACTLFRSQVQSVVDCGCGDMNWMSRFLRTHFADKLAYYGVDLFNIPENRERFPGWTFLRRDFISHPLPRVDMAVARNTLQYLSNGEVQAAIDNMRAAGIRFLLADTDDALERNRPLLFHSRQLNLALPPYNLPLQHTFPTDGVDTDYHVYRLLDGESGGHEAGGRAGGRAGSRDGRGDTTGLRKRSDVRVLPGRSMREVKEKIRKRRAARGGSPS